MAASCCLPEVYVKPQNKKISSLRLSLPPLLARRCITVTSPSLILKGFDPLKITDKVIALSLPLQVQASPSSIFLSISLKEGNLHPSLRRPSGCLSPRTHETLSRFRPPSPWHLVTLICLNVSFLPGKASIFSQCEFIEGSQFLNRSLIKAKAGT